jgi:hypothetical protein
MPVRAAVAELGVTGRFEGEVERGFGSGNCRALGNPLLEAIYGVSEWCVEKKGNVWSQQAVLCVTLVYIAGDQCVMTADAIFWSPVWSGVASH